MAHKSIIRFIDNLFFIEGEKGVVGLGGCGGVEGALGDDGIRGRGVKSVSVS